MALSRKTKKIIIIVGSLLAFYCLVGFVVIPWVIESKLPPTLSEQLRRPVVLKNVDFNPFTLSLRAQEFEIQEVDQSPLIGFKDLFINFQLSSLFRQSYTFDEIRLTLPYGLLKIHSDGSLNVADLSQSSTSQPDETETQVQPESAEESSLPAIDIYHLAIDQGVLEFRDESKPVPFSADIVPIQFTVNNFSTRPDSENPHAMTAEFTEGEVLRWEGTFSLDPFQSAGTLALSGLKLRTAWEYLQDQLRFEIADGVLNISTEYRLEPTSEGLEAYLSDGEAQLSQFKLIDEESREELLSIPTFGIQGIQVNVPQQQVTIPTVRSSDALVKGWLNPDGSLNYQTLFATKNDSAEPEEASSESSDHPWTVFIQDFTLENYGVALEDRTPSIPVQLDLQNINLGMKNISSTFDQPVNLALSLTFNETGTIEVGGNVELDPIFANLDVHLDQVALKPFEPYLEPFVQLSLASGAFGLQGKVQYHGTPEEKPMLHYEGGVGLSKFAVADLDHSKEFLKWDSLDLKNMVVDVEPTNITIETITLNKPFAEATIANDGSVNIARAFSPPQEGDQPDPVSEPTEDVSSSEAKDPIPIKIETVQIQGATAQFTDQSITPHVATGIQDFGGTIKGLSSQQLTKAKVDLKGKVDKYAPIAIKGQINPLSKDLYTDLAFLFDNWDLTTVSSYSGAYAGYPITKGKLSLDLKYKVSENSLKGDNKILVDQLTMGDHIDSPDALSLPIPLALALLKDRKGQIDIDLPVEGDLNDPEFSYGGIIIQALVNLITKAATSPFGALGNLLAGSEEDFQFVEFPPGSLDLPEKEQEKLSTLAKALMDRPALRLEIAGGSDTQTDRRQLAEEQLIKDLKIAKVQQSPSSGSSPSQAVETIELSPEEETRLIKQLFIQKFGKEAVGKLGNFMNSSGEKKPGIPSGSEAASDLENKSKDHDHKDSDRNTFPVDLAKQRLLETIQISEDQLRLLARERAKIIQDYLIQVGQIPEDRLFLIEVQLGEDSASESPRSPISLTAS